MKSLLLLCAVVVAVMPVPGPAAQASCVGPYLTMRPDGRMPTRPLNLDTHGTVAVSGRAFVDGCDDTGGSEGGGPFGCHHSGPEELVVPMRDVRLVLRQHGHRWALGTADASGRTGAVRWLLRLPAGVHTGQARLLAVHDGRPVARAPVTVR